MEWIFVTLASMFAGFVDAVVGGGGLILVPALFGAFPAAPPATLLGTNKSAGVWGTLISARQYARRVDMRWAAIAPAAGAGFVASLLGAWAVTVVDPSMLRKALPIILIAVLAYTLYKKQLGQTHAPRYSGRTEAWVACAIGATIGFYDGFFGPGTGSFFVFLMVRWLGYDFLNASASAKILNIATNVAALILFTAKGHVWCQHPGQYAWHLDGLEKGLGLCARHVHRRRGRADPQDRLRRLFALNGGLGAGLHGQPCPGMALRPSPPGSEAVFCGLVRCPATGPRAYCGGSVCGFSWISSTRLGVPIGARPSPRCIAAISASLGYSPSSQ